MYSVIVRVEDSWYLLPGDEWPGTVLFDRFEDARAVVKQVVGLLINPGGDEDFIEGAKAVEIKEVV